MSDAPLLAFSPVTSPSTGTNKRPADDTSSPITNMNNKRPAPEQPSMNKQAAARAVKSLVPPKAPKKQSQYLRFKSEMLKIAKCSGDTDTVKNISTAAKTEWNKVKNMAVPARTAMETLTSKSIADFSDTAGLIRIKGCVIEEEANEASAYQTQLNKFRTDFLDAAIAFLMWNTMDATEGNVVSCEAAVEMVHSKATVAWGTALPTTYGQAYNDAREQLNVFKKNVTVSDLVHKLRNASDGDLLQHVKEHYEALMQVQELNMMKTEIASLQAAKKVELEKELKSASSIKKEMLSALKKQMVYTDSSLKHSSETITFNRGGVSPAMFAVAFGVEEGTKEVTIEGSEVGTKPLRYSYLICKDVTVKLVGGMLSAKTFYKIG